jgi:putative oxidoreductase
MLNVIRKADGLLGQLNESVLLLFVRIVAGHVFWASGRTKIEGLLTLRPEAVDLFRDEYRLPLIAPEIAAPMAAFAEHLLPILLVMGLFTRFAALGLIVMTLVIQFLVYPDAWWPQHSLWLGLLLIILARGPGGLSLDRWMIGSAK